MDVNKIFGDDTIPHSSEKDEQMSIKALEGQRLVTANYHEGVYDFTFESGTMLAFTPKGTIWGRTLVN